MSADHEPPHPAGLDVLLVSAGSTVGGQEGEDYTKNTPQAHSWGRSSIHLYFLYSIQIGLLNINDI